MLLTKLLNGIELTWDSFDERERQIVLYFMIYTLVAAFAALQRRSREQLKRELREEIGRGDTTRT